VAFCITAHGCRTLAVLLVRELTLGVAIGLAATTILSSLTCTTRGRARQRAN
jgi:type III secretory pathway component EscT